MATSHRTSISVENIESLCGVCTGEGEIVIQEVNDDGTRRFSFEWSNRETIPDVFNSSDFEFQYLKDAAVLELVPLRSELKSMLITFKDSDSRDLFKAKAEEFERSEIRKRRNTTGKTARTNVRQKKTLTVAQENVSSKRNGVTSAVFQGMELEDLHVRYSDLSEPSKTGDKTDVGMGKVETGDSSSSGNSGSSSPNLLRSEESSVEDLSQADEDSNEDTPESNQEIPESNSVKDEGKYINEEDDNTHL